MCFYINFALLKTKYTQESLQSPCQNQYTSLEDHTYLQYLLAHVKVLLKYVPHLLQVDVQVQWHHHEGLLYPYRAEVLFPKPLQRKQTLSSVDRCDYIDRDPT